MVSERSVSIKRLLLIWVSFLLPITAFAQDEPQEKLLEEVEVTTSLKEKKCISDLPVSANAFSISKIDNINVTSTKDLSSFVPNFHLPEYGSQMTSSIYVRGFGARIDQPVVALIVDEVPILNKNAFDTDLFDLQRVEFFRGPQGTLYGRNAMCGLIHLHTLSPFIYQGSKFSADYSTGNSIKIKASTYQKPSEKFAFSVAANALYSKGFFTNEYDGSMCDPSKNLSLRSRQIWRTSSSLNIENSLSFNLLRQGGYAYSSTVGDTHLPINYNDECHYNRLSATDGLILKYNREKFDFSFITSYQYLNDDMLLDNDFLPQSIFTLNQKQKEHTISEELVFQSKRKEKVWNWKSGAYGFFKHNTMDAPVTFEREGINQLILDNANNGIHKVFPTENLDILENEFVISSNFELPTFGVAAYHQSEFRVGKWDFTAGLRLDYEKAKMTYKNGTDIHYIFTLLMKDYKQLSSWMDGTTKKDFFEILPKLAVQYHIDDKNQIYAYAAKGYKAGGFNTQIFSDILQNKLKDDMMQDLGMKFDDMTGTNYNTEEAIAYDPEYNWTYELGAHFSWAKDQLNTDISLFYIDCKNQQLTVFPEGKNTGRMMTNAGKSRSFGGELSVHYTHNNLELTGSYGYTNAKFVEFNDGHHSYNGNYVPFSPTHSPSIQAQYSFFINRKVLDKIIAIADWKGIGEIYWDEANEVKQPFYSLFGASVIFQKGNFQLKGWCKNIGNKYYDTFYFVSMGNQFSQAGKPRQFGVSLNYELK